MILILEILITVFCVSLEWYIPGAIMLVCLSLLRLIRKFGNGSFFLELVYFFTTLTCLLMPVLGFTIFTKSNPVALLWFKYMPVDQVRYFAYLLPACTLFSLSFFAFRSGSVDDHAFTKKVWFQIRELAQIVPSGIIRSLYFISLVAYNISYIIPDAFKQVNNFLYLTFYSSLFYIYYKVNFPKRVMYLVGGFLFILVDALRSGMFTVIAYMSGIFLILMLAGVKIRFQYRIVIVFGALASLGYLQLFKLDWREQNWENRSGQANAIVRSLEKNRATKVESVLFPLYVRMNQGFNIGLVMRRIPYKVDHLGGDYLFTTFVSSFVPRLFWPDKPEAGGKANMRIYTGLTLKGWSTNVGPVGEAYGSFGVVYGCIYLFFFGLFIRSGYIVFLKVCRTHPTMFLWMPLLFFQLVYVMETDSLQAFNSMMKGALFMLILYRLAPGLFPKSTHESSVHRTRRAPALPQFGKGVPAHS